MGDEGNLGEPRNQGESHGDVPSFDNPPNETQPGQDEADQSARATGGHMRALLARLSLTDWITAVGTAVIACATIWNVVVVTGQLGEMHSSGVDTHNLAVATQNLSERAKTQADAMDKLRIAGELQAKAMDRLRIAGEAQATSMERLKAAGEEQAKAAEGLADAGRAQALATRNLAENSARQLGAIQASADAAKAQAIAVQEQAAASITAGKATDRLAASGQAQAAAVVQSLDVARAANDIAARASVAADRPWISISMPLGDTEPVAGQDYKIDFNVLNVGRSPALDARINVAINIIKVADKFDSILETCAECQRLTIFPSGGSFQATNITFHPTLAAPTITADEVKRIADKTDVIVLRTRADYVDTSRNAHMTSGCMYFIPKFGFTSCSIGNQAN